MQEGASGYGALPSCTTCVRFNNPLMAYGRDRNTMLAAIRLGRHIILFDNPCDKLTGHPSLFCDAID